MENEHNKQLLQAAKNRDLQKAIEALNAGAEPNCQHPVMRCTPLQFAVWNGDAELVKLLLQSGAKPVYYDGASVCLGSAAKAGNVAIVSLLLDAGEDINRQANWGARPIDLARIYGHAELRDFLVARGANTKKTNPSVANNLLLNDRLPDQKPPLDGIGKFITMKRPRAK